MFQVKVLTSGSSKPLATQSVAASTTPSTSATVLSNQGKLYKVRIFLLVDLGEFFFRLGSGGREKKEKKTSENDQLTGHFQSLFYTPANFVCVGYTVFTLSVRPCVRPSVTFCFLNILKSLLDFHQNLQTCSCMQDKYFRQKSKG